MVSLFVSSDHALVILSFFLFSWFCIFKFHLNFLKRKKIKPVIFFPHSVILLVHSVVVHSDPTDYIILSLSQMYGYAVVCVECKFQFNC